MDVEDATFMDLVCLLKITPDTVLDKFGGLINASFFDASNIAGTLKQKNLIDFTSTYPGPNAIIVTPSGKAFVDEANAKSTEPFDTLDDSILKQLSGGKRVPTELAASLNIRNKDLALHLYKLYKQEFINYELKNGGVEVMLTEKGFIKANTPNVQVQSAQQTTTPQAAQAPQTTAEPQNHNAEIAEQAKELQAGITKNKKGSKTKWIAAVIVVIVLIVFALVYKHVI